MLLEELALAAMPLAEAEIARDDMGKLSQELGINKLLLL